MYVIREVLHCKPGKVRQMADKFRAISHALQEMGHEPMRLLTDVSGEPFWTIVAEAKVEKIDDFFAVEQKLTQRQMFARVLRPRVVVYAAILWLIAASAAASLWLRVPLKVDVGSGPNWERAH